MKDATSITGFAARTGRGAIRVAHIGLVAVGLASVAHLGSDYFRHDPVSLADTGLFDVQAAVGAPALESGDRWRVAPFALIGEVENVSLGGGLKASRAAQGLQLSDEMERVRDWVAQRYRVSSVALEPVLATAEATAREAGLDPLLIVAMMAIESSFNPMAESHAGAQGLMQVIPRWHMDKIGDDAPEDALFDPVFNVQVGTQVLVEGLQRYGTLQAALQYYGGARNDPEARYTKRVLSMKARLASAARIADAGA